ncbi:MAG: helix-turn-helix domain-containing protein [Rhizobiales bacterium]|nr:helix-turn-helix domain-containing protein [Hyphomicrobiales bacterium]
MSTKAVRAAMLAAIELLGSEWKLAEAIGYTQHAVWRAKTIGRVSARMATAIEAATDGKIKRLDLCPVCYGPATIRRPSEIRAAS